MSQTVSFLWEVTGKLITSAAGSSCRFCSDRVLLPLVTCWFHDLLAFADHDC